MKKSGLLCGAATMVIASAAITAPAFAQDDTAGTGRDTIVVTARKTEESLQDAPLSISAITEEDINRKGITNVDDVARFAPGLSFSKAFGRSTDRPVIRGNSNVLANVQFGVESGTAYFVDGVYYPTTLQSLDFNLIKQVEVIRGPQSALYGRNTYAGAINFVTIDPSEEFTANLRGRAANGGEKMIAGNISMPIIPGVFGGLVSASYYEYDGQFTNEITGKKVGDEQTWNVSGIFSFTPTENVRGKLRVTYQEDDDGPLALFLQGSAENNCWPGFRSNRYRTGGALSGTPGAQNDNQYFCGIIEPGAVRLNTDVGLNGEADGTAFDGIERELLIIGGNVDVDLSDTLTLSLQGGYRDETELFGTDSDHSDANLIFGPPTVAESFFALTNRDEVSDYSLEARLEWSPTDRFRFMAGGFYYDQKITGTDITKLTGRAGTVFAADNLALGCSPTVSCTDRSTLENWAVFGLAEIGITDRLRLTGEIRYMEETKGLIQISGLGAGDPNGILFDDENTESYVTPRITLDYQLNDDVLLYGVFAEGVKPGGFNGADGEEVGSPTYDPETANSFEIGAKASWFDGILTTNVSGYYIDATDVQLTTAIPATGAVNSIATNQGQGEVFGAEVEMFYSPSENWDFIANYAWTRPEFTEGCDADQWIFTSGGGAFFGSPDSPLNGDFTNVFGGTASCDISGNKYPLVSEHMASGSATYSKPISGDMEFFVTGNATYEGSKYVQVHNQAETGSALIFGGQFGVRGDNWQAFVFARNLTNEDAIAIATRWFDLRYGLGPNVPQIAMDGGSFGPNGISTSFPRGFFGSLRRPRQIGIEFSYSFN